MNEFEENCLRMGIMKAREILWKLETDEAEAGEPEDGSPASCLFGDFSSG